MVSLWHSLIRFYNICPPRQVMRVERTWLKDHGGRPQASAELWANWRELLTQRLCRLAGLQGQKVEYSERLHQSIYSTYQHCTSVHMTENLQHDLMQQNSVSLWDWIIINFNVFLVIKENHHPGQQCDSNVTLSGFWTQWIYLVLVCPE